MYALDHTQPHLRARSFTAQRLRGASPGNAFFQIYQLDTMVVPCRRAHACLFRHHDSVSGGRERTR
jgi:hypothetical protein